MIEKSTVLVLGTGASEPYRYPIGSELKDRIITDLKEMIDNNLGWVAEFGFDKGLVSIFNARFAMFPGPSIDSFLA